MEQMIQIWKQLKVDVYKRQLDRQIKYLRDYGIEERNIITDTCTGVNFRRTGYNALSKVLLKKGDTLVIPSIDRLGRNKKSTEKAYNNLVDKGDVYKRQTYNCELE